MISRFTWNWGILWRVDSTKLTLYLNNPHHETTTEPPTDHFYANTYTVKLALNSKGDCIFMLLLIVYIVDVRLSKSYIKTKASMITLL